MSDIFSPEKRSEIMSSIRGRNTSPELLVRKFLFSKGFRYRLHQKDLPGRPDVVMKKYATCIFIHGCFWHGHKRCSLASIPKTNKAFWLAKIDANRKRDLRNRKQLKKSGWKVIEIWECGLKPSKRDATLCDLLTRLESA